MTIHAFHFVLGILVPYFAEQYAYSRFISNIEKPEATEPGTVAQGYGWRLIWDASYFLLVISTGYRIILVMNLLSAFEWLGYFCFLLGVLLRILSLKEIGRFYDPGIVIKVDHQMVNTGPYRTLRHPLHLGTLMQIIGLAGFSPIWLALPAVTASLVLCLYLNRTEDRAHSQQLGAIFNAYYSKTWDIIDLFFRKNKME